jgi:hypothetical protein
MNEDDFKELSPNSQKGLYSSAHVISGIPIPKTQRVQLFGASGALPAQVIKGWTL